MIHLLLCPFLVSRTIRSAIRAAVMRMTSTMDKHRHTRTFFQLLKNQLVQIEIPCVFKDRLFAFLPMMISDVSIGILPKSSIMLRTSEKFFHRLLVDDYLVCEKMETLVSRFLFVRPFASFRDERFVPSHLIRLLSRTLMWEKTIVGKSESETTTNVVVVMCADSDCKMIGSREKRDDRWSTDWLCFFTNDFRWPLMIWWFPRVAREEWWWIEIWIVGLRVLARLIRTIN